MNTKTFLSAMLLTLMTALLSCTGNQGKKEEKPAGTEVNIDSASMIVPEFAKGFTVNYVSDDVCLVEVGDPQHVLKESDDDEDYQMPVDYRFALVRNGAKADVPEGYKVVNVPIERTICMTSLQLSNFTALDAHGVIRGITGTKNLFDEDIKSRVKAGDIVEVRKPPVTYSFRILQAIEKRVGAKLIPEILETVTAPEQYEWLEMSRISGFVGRAKGTGRPTKKERRSLEEFTSDTPVFFGDFDFDMNDDEEEE